MQWLVFKDCCRLKKLSARKIWFDELNRKYDRSAPSLFTSTPKKDKISFVMFGTAPSKEM
jgi:hypothetical protein